MQLDLAESNVERMPLPAADVAIICAAISRFADCRERPELARRVDVTAPAVLGRRLTDAGCRVVLLSTSAVLDGLKPHAGAASPPAPSSQYGALKAEAENAILSLGEDAAVLRLTKVVTPEMALVRGWIEALGAGRPVNAFTDMTLAPISLDDVASGLIGVVDDRGGSGVYQLSGAADVTYFELAEHLARRLGASSSLVRPARAADTIPSGEVMRYTTLDTGRLSKLTGWAAPRPFELIDRVFAPALAASRARTEH
jgi:dTDP-4-dehydrorhamnose reductase